jgi:hypothetical protein
MTDVLVRELEPFPAPHPVPTRPERASIGGAVAALSAAAAAIHLVMVPAHFDEWAPEGIGFAVAGWAQLTLAALVLRRGATRPLLRATAWGNAALILAWVVSRTRGLPVGPESGVREAAGRVDVTCVAIEAALVALCVVALARRHGSSLVRRAAVLAAVVAVVGSTAAIASPDARDHAHGGDAAASAADDHGHVAASDLGLGMLSNGHHDAITVQRLAPAVQAELDAQLAITREVARQHPTLADALAAGYRPAGPFSPGLGLHVTRFNQHAFNGDGRMDEDDLRNPMSIIYDGTSPDSVVAGFMYYSGASEKPEGFAGSNDHWHYHTNVCIKGGANGGTEAPLGADRSVTRAQCDAVGGMLLTRTQWMVHVWTVPGYEVAVADGGTFGEVNPDLRCPDGTYFVMPIREWRNHPTNVCRSELRA